MLSALLEHVRRTSLAECAKSSFFHCHAQHVDSVMLIDHPGQRVRMFVARPGHDLHINHPTCGFFTVAIHPHHCPLTLVPLFGEIYQVNAYRCGSQAVGINRPMKLFRYESSLLGGKGTFAHVGDEPSVNITMDSLLRPRFMKADEWHTMGVRTECAAWMVFEGPDDPHYEPLCMNTRMPVVPDWFYEPMSENDVADTLDFVIRRMAT